VAVRAVVLLRYGVVRAAGYGFIDHCISAMDERSESAYLPTSPIPGVRNVLVRVSLQNKPEANALVST
jgi:hypothetical protein